MPALFQTAADDTAPAWHVLIIGVSAYDHLPGGRGPLTAEPMAHGIGQLGAAATSATRVALWFRDHFDSPTAATGSIRLLVSPSPGELPLPEGVLADPATFENVRAAVAAWRKDLRKHPDNVAVLYAAGHGIQTSAEGGILLLQDFGSPDSLTPLERAVDVASVRLGMVSDPNRPDTSTPQLQFYFYDACRVTPKPADGYNALVAGVSLDNPKGTAAKASWVCFGAKPQDYALAVLGTRTTLYSQALLECLDRRAQVAEDGRTLRFGGIQTALEEVVAELAAQYDEQQDATLGGAGSLAVPVHRRPDVPGVSTRGPNGGPVREVVLSSDTNSQVSIRGEGGELVGEYPSRGRLGLPLGHYEAVLPLPWGGEASTPFAVEARSQRIEVTVNAPESALALGGRPRLQRLLSAAGDPRSTEVEPFQLRFLRWAEGSFAPVPEHDTPTVDVADGDPDTVTLQIEGTEPVHLQVYTDSGRSLVVSLPIGLASDPSMSLCIVHVRNGERSLAATVRLYDRRLDTVAGYLVSGRADRALASFPDLAERLLYSKVTNPIGAALGGYALLQLNELDRLHDWPANLSAWFSWLPDGPVIAATLAARTGNAVAAAESFLDAASRGLPLFSAGLSLLAAGAAAVVGDESVPGELRERLAATAGPIQSLAATAAFGSLTTNLQIDPRYLGAARMPSSARFALPNLRT